MTNRDFLNAIIKNDINDEVIAHATATLEKLDATNKKRRNTPSKTQKANAPLVELILNGVLTAEPKTASDVAAELGISVQKASAVLRSIVADGKAVQGETKVAKKGVQKTYTLAE